MVFAIDTNLLVYAHTSDSEFHQQAVQFIERMFNDLRDATVFVQEIREYLFPVSSQDTSHEKEDGGE